MRCAIVNGTVVTDGRMLRQNVFFSDGLIAEISERAPTADETVIDAAGKYIMPGFIDMHCHGAMGHDFMDGDSAGVEIACNYHAKCGTTTIFPTTCTTSVEATVRAIEAIEAASPRSRIGGIHMESFFFSPSQCGAQDPRYLLSPTEENLRPFDARIGRSIKRISYAPEIEGAADFERAMQGRGVVLSAGHTDAQLPDMLRAEEMGCTLVTHLYSCTSTITRRGGFRSLGVIESALLSDTLFVELIADGCHIPPPLLRLVYKTKGAGQMCLVTDANEATGSDAKTATIGGNPCIIEDGVAKLPDRSAFAGSIATADRLLREAVRAGIPLPQAVRMLTENPARVMGLSGVGRVAVGYCADIVLMDDALQIADVLVDGVSVL